MELTKEYAKVIIAALDELEGYTGLLDSETHILAKLQQYVETE